jgi:hypothetical protein
VFNVAVRWPGPNHVNVDVAASNRFGVASITWVAGDGTVKVRSRQPLAISPGDWLSGFSHGYWVSRSYTNSVTVTDRAGNQATRSFLVTPPPDRIAPGTTVVRTTRRLRRTLDLFIRRTEHATVMATATVRVGERPYRLRTLRRGLSRVPMNLRFELPARVRRAIAAGLRRRVPVVAHYRFVAVDRAGNRSVARHSTPIVG